MLVRCQQHLCVTTEASTPSKCPHPPTPATICMASILQGSLVRKHNVFWALCSASFNEECDTKVSKVGFSEEFCLYVYGTINAQVTSQNKISRPHSGPYSQVILLSMLPVWETNFMFWTFFFHENVFEQWISYWVNGGWRSYLWQILLVQYQSERFAQWASPYLLTSPIYKTHWLNNEV